ncbi:hypothetical protein PR048_012153 [Dryococelus australis]|uniref:RBPJ-interacting and tubulin-associated protein 1 n=1 Tax=Dryococelus australis TaxID=614101 RepID=A0ABQ9HNN0_9NEOP|nr:hypothetical protein PR048_012153 [Dryococelus australis]
MFWDSPMRVKRVLYGTSPECKGGVKREIPKKPIDQRHLQKQFLCMENPGATLPGTEASSHWWEASTLAAKSPRPTITEGKLLASVEQRRNGRAWESEDPRVNPPTSGIVRHDSHMRKPGSGPAGNRTWFV